MLRFFTLMVGLLWRLSILAIMLMIGVAIAEAQVQEATGPYRAGYLRDACLTFTRDATVRLRGERSRKGRVAQL